MPEPVASGRRYLPGLDGLRALAVSAVVLYHLGFAWAGGGLLGVGVFFTLSGYLITDLLLAGFAAGPPSLAGFWLARGRRLLPALLTMLVLVSAWVELAGRGWSGFGSALVGAVLYVSNWQLIFQHVSYFARFGPPSPIGHLWSLAIEEQFYLLWPLLLLLGVRLVREGSRLRGVRPRLALLTAILATASASEMALLYRPGFDPSRVYDGTDTRAFELLIGAALAMVWPSRQLRADVAAPVGWLVDAAGLVGLAGIGVLVWRTDEYSPFLYRGGLVLLSLATALTVAALVHPAARLGRVVGVAPLRWLGARSYGIYLWHLPIIVLTTPASEHATSPLRAAPQVAATVAAAGISWRFLEQPVRHGALGRVWREARAGGWHPLRPSPSSTGGRSRAAALAAIAALALTTADGDVHGSLTGSAIHAAARTTVRVEVARAVPALTLFPRPRVPVVAPAPAPTRSSCRAVVDIGDSTSEGLISPDYLPNPNLRIEARYAAIGVRVQHYEISGARSIVETYDGEPNAAAVAQGWRRDGYRGCWLLALGTNDTADVYVGSNIGRLARIREMMSIIGRQPVLWVDVKSLLSSGPYSEHNMRLWNDALLQACRSYPNLRVFDWASLARARWFISDGIHYNTPGYAARARLIAAALARAFPAHGGHPGCVVR